LLAEAGCTSASKSRCFFWSRASKRKPGQRLVGYLKVPFALASSIFLRRFSFFSFSFSAFSFSSSVSLSGGGSVQAERSAPFDLNRALRSSFSHSCQP